ncbi:MAG: hypothetical protein ACPG49_08795, partial [Chitinophagales bacterium]
FSPQLQQLETYIEGQLKNFVQRLPEVTDIAQTWQQINQPAIASLESKTTLKLKLDLFFVALERDITFDDTSYMKSAGKEIMEFFKGKRKFKDLFWVKEKEG